MQINILANIIMEEWEWDWIEICFVRFEMNVFMYRVCSVYFYMFKFFVNTEEGLPSIYLCLWQYLR